MAKLDCAIIPKVMDKKGNKVDSKLFKDLLNFMENRSEVVRIYLITKGEEFIAAFKDKLSYDDNNEPTFVSLLKSTNLREKVSEDKILKKLNKEIGFYNKNMTRPKYYLNNNENHKLLVDKAISFNNNSDFRNDYTASVIKMQDNESNRVFIGVKVEKKTPLNSVDASKMEYNQRLNNKLRDILTSYGISIGALTELEERRGINGVTDFDVAKDAATQLIEMIRLSNGIKGEKALPEEFSHFIIEAMKDNPLIKRLLSTLNNESIVKEILGNEFDTYSELYNNDLYKLTTEAAGKLLAKHLLKQEPLISNKPYKNILERVIQAIKQFFSRIDSNNIQRAIYDAEKSFGVLARDILTGNINDINVDNISSGVFYQTNERVQRDKKLLQEIINTELKRLNIYKNRNSNKKFSIKQGLLLDTLEMNLLDNNEIEGIYNMLDNTLSELNKLNLKLDELSVGGYSINQKAAVLRDIRNYLFSYGNIIKDIRQAVVEEELYSDNRYGERVKVVLNSTSNLLDDLLIRYNNTAIPLFTEFIKPFLGENVIVPFGKNKDKEIKAEELVKLAQKDITFFDRWLDSMADSSDFILKVIDQATKTAKENARLSTINIMKELQAANIRLEKAGVKDTEWMFELDSKGNKSGNYISGINQSLIKENITKLYKDLESKYGKNPKGQDAINYSRERAKWYSDNMEIVDGKKQYKLSIYGNKSFDNLNKSQKEFYEIVMNIKSNLDLLLPEDYTKLTNAITIRKDLIERVKSSTSLTSGTKEIWESVKDEFLRRVDDTDFGSKSTILDFEGNTVQMLPIYYTDPKKMEDKNSLSTDIVTTFTAYAAMANDFNEMNKVIDILELGRDSLRERQVEQTEGGKTLLEKFKSAGRTVENKLTKSGDQTKFMQRLNDFFDMQIYGRYMKDEGTFGNTKIDKAKSANLINRITSIQNLAINVLSGISNPLLGTVMMHIESIASEYFNVKNTIIADKNYSKHLPEFLSEIGNRVKTSKLALWGELFNTMQEYEQGVREINFDRKTWFSRMFGTSSLFFMNNAGEHWMQNRTSLALADAYKMKSPTGEIVSLWDAMEVVSINNKSEGAKLQVKNGYTKEDGSIFTTKDIIDFSRRSAAINQRMHGIYNKADRSAFQKLAIGRMAIMFRKWVKPNLNRRFHSVRYNYDIKDWTEGYYITMIRFSSKLIKDIRKSQFDIASNWNELNKTEKANIRRALTEVSHFVMISAVIGLLDWDEDDKNRPWLSRMVEYQLRRLRTELGVLMPGPQMLNESLKLVQSPFAAIPTAQSIIDLLELMNPTNYELIVGEKAIIESGNFKGYSKAQKLLLRSPLVPLRKNIMRGIDPEDAIQFYKQ